MIIFCLKFKVGEQLSRYEIQATHIQKISYVRTAGREEIFTEVSSFFMNKSEYRSLLRTFLTFGKASKLTLLSLNRNVHY